MGGHDGCRSESRMSEPHDLYYYVQLDVKCSCGLIEIGGSWIQQTMWMDNPSIQNSLPIKSPMSLEVRVRRSVGKQSCVYQDATMKLTGRT